MLTVIQLYEKLESLDRSLIQAVGFSFGTVTSECLQAWVCEAGLRRDDDKPFTLTLVRERRDALYKAGLLISYEGVIHPNGKTWTLHPDLQLHLSMGAHDSFWYTALAKSAVEELWPFLPRWNYKGNYFKSAVLLLQSLILNDSAKIGSLSQQVDFLENIMPINSEILALFSHFLIHGLLPGIPKPLVNLLNYIFDYNVESALRFQNTSSLFLADGIPRGLHPTLEQSLLLQRMIAFWIEGRVSEILSLPKSQVEACTVCLGIQSMALLLVGKESEALELMESLLLKQSDDPKQADRYFLRFPLAPLQVHWYLSRHKAPLPKLQTWLNTLSPLLQGLCKRIRSFHRHWGKSGAWNLYYKETYEWDPEASVLPLIVDTLVNTWFAGSKYLPLTEPGLLLKQLMDRKSYWAALELATSGAIIEKSAFWIEAQKKMEALTEISYPFSNWFANHDIWALKLQKLLELKLNKKNIVEDVSGQEMLCFLFSPEDKGLEPVLRKQLKNGKWSAPKSIALTTLAKGLHPALQEIDRPILKAIDSSDGYPIFYTGDAFMALPGHPRVFLASDPDQTIEFQAKETKLVTKPKGDKLLVCLSDRIEDRSRLTQLGPRTWEVLRASPEILKVAEVVGSGFVVPATGRAQVTEVLGQLTKALPVESPLIGEHALSVTKEPDSRCIVQIFPEGTRLGVKVGVRPLGQGNLLPPGTGVPSLNLPVGKEIFFTQRNLTLEMENLLKLREACPNLESCLGLELQGTLEGGFESLEVLSELKNLGDAVVLEWPQGEKIKLSARIQGQGARLQMTSGMNWFDLSGNLEMDNHKALNLLEAMELVPRFEGRFVALGEGQYLEIEVQLLRQLQQIYRVGKVVKGSVRLSPLALLSNPLLQNEGSTTSATPETRQIRAKLIKAFEEEYPLPRGLIAELRPYQVEGFQWLSRLTEAGAGACLADDMGLGKTVQCIALLCSRRNGGPALVVAPASVASNWVSEILRFTTDLEPVSLPSTDREGRVKVVQALKAGQVLVITYGLLVSEEELLNTLEWHTLVVDEAHALKNQQAKRTQSAFSLKARARLALTGTPLQNHLGELWSLFEMLNPGYLGDQKSFRHKFLLPIEEQKDEGARNVLKTLIRPLVLRRTKGQVLQDLPPKTEITLTVDLGPEEQNWYNALSIKIRKEMEQAAKSPEAKTELRFKILAWLMTLRRASCHPTLTAKGPQVEFSAKQEKLLELLGEMAENDHRALVFSQFTDHLALIKGRLEGAGILYEYLDGSTPLKERSKRIEAFQAGSTPVFLISLQAGGVGLNLTAADYVIHMDPWWNPAAEDQASDRAHRIGQTRPVTVYRLVAANTIEERILSLHHKKRGLADALLEGSEAAAKLSAQELMELLEPQNG